MTREELLTLAKSILFNTEMVKVILKGRKTVTRRIVKFLDNKNPNWTGYIKDGLTLYNGTNEPCNKKPPYAAGDYLYVRETWNICNMDIEEPNITFIYKADENELESARTVKISQELWDKYDYSMAENNPEWRPSIHMPKEAARIFLKVTDVRVERLQDMTLKDAHKEGIDVRTHAIADGERLNPNSDFSLERFETLWDSTIDKKDLDTYGWNANPWVWVIEFERVEV